MNTPQQYAQASIKTADNLRTIAHSMLVLEVSSLSLPEVDAAVDIISGLVPAGNVPGVILNGLARHQIELHPVDRITAWLMAAVHILHQYPDLLANEWRERIYLSLLLRQITNSMSLFTDSGKNNGRTAGARTLSASTTMPLIAATNLINF